MFSTEENTTFLKQRGIEITKMTRNKLLGIEINKVGPFSKHIILGLYLKTGIKSIQKLIIECLLCSRPCIRELKKARE